MRELYFLDSCRHPTTFDNDVFSNTLRLHLTYECNLDCEYCYIRGAKRPSKHWLSLDDFDKLLLWMKDKGWHGVRFAGGEPLLYPDLKKIIQRCRESGIRYGMATNATGPSDVFEEMKRDEVSLISVNYCIDSLKGFEKENYLRNLSILRKKKIRYELSFVIGEKQIKDSFIAIAKKYKPGVIRFCLPVPGAEGKTSIDSITVPFKKIKKNIFAMIDMCLRNGILVYMYRPLLRCLFTDSEWFKINKLFPNLCFTRCPLGCLDEYTGNIVVNPDLSFYPCVAVLDEGRDITSFKTRNSLNMYIKEKMSPFIHAPNLKECEQCRYYKNFIKEFDDCTRKLTPKQAYSDEKCQSGCYSFAYARELCCPIKE